MRTAWSASLASLAVVASWCGCFLSTEGVSPTGGSGGGTTGMPHGGAGGGTGGEGATGGNGSGGCTPGAKMGCYTGLPETANTGECKTGQKTCKSDGTGFGPCVGEVTPVPENCVLATDQDCDGTVTTCTGKPAWSVAYGDGGDDVAYDVARDEQGNLIVVGTFTGMVDFGGGPFTTAPDDYDVFVVKYSPEGQVLWRKQITGKGNNAANAVATDPSGDVFVCGYFEEDIDFGGASPVAGAGGTDAFVVKLSTTGVLLWGKTFGDSSDQTCTAVAADSSGDVAFAGHFAGGITVADSLSSQNSNEYDGYVAKLNAAGSAQWARQIKGASNGYEFVNGLAVDQAKNVLLVGTAQGNVDFAGTQLAGHGSNYDVLVAKISPLGAVTWAKLFGDSDYQSASDVALTGAAGHFVVAGSFDGTLTFDQAYTSAGDEDIFVVELDPSGGAVRSEAFGGTGKDRAFAVSVDSFGNIAITGDFDQPLSFGATALTPMDGRDVFVARLDPYDMLIWAQRFGEQGDDVGWSVACDAVGRCAVAGSFDETITFALDTFTSKGGFDAFLAVFNP